MTEHSRLIVLNFEISGFEPEFDHRIIEFGSVEIIDHRITGEEFHRYFNPERKIDLDVKVIHGIRSEFLQTKPTFFEEFENWNNWLGDSSLLIFSDLDREFLDAEYMREDHTPIAQSRITLVHHLAQQVLPNEKSYSLSALCNLLEIRLPGHCSGALLDAYALAEVYLALNRRSTH